MEKSMNKIKNIMADILGVDEESIVSTTRLKEDLNADSLKLVQFLLAIEDEFQIELEDEDAIAVKTFADIERLMKKYGVDN